jgi:hypothetical protein
MILRQILAETGSSYSMAAYSARDRDRCRMSGRGPSIPKSTYFSAAGKLDYYTESPTNFVHITQKNVEIEEMKGAGTKCSGPFHFYDLDIFCGRSNQNAHKKPGGNQKHVILC